jgi:hypothetical protein
MDAAERAIATSGVVLAATVATFASIQIFENDGAPKVNGVEHLALFARPAKARDEARRQASPAPIPDVPVEIDREPTATIRSRSNPIFGDTPPTGRAAWRIVQVDRDRVVIEDDSGRIVVRKGDRAPDGRVLTAIIARQGGWMAVWMDSPSLQTSR